MQWWASSKTTKQLSSQRRIFFNKLQIYLLNCYTRLCEETDLLQQFDLGLKAKKDLTAEQLLEYAKEVDGSLLNSLEITINMGIINLHCCI
jgi:hypothetical protein